MALSAGTRLGPYEIVSPLGAGGMGEVYRARDTRLGRDVAIKILPAQVSADSARKQRFEREARVISNLNHPHICVLHDIGAQDGVDYLVMECIEGESLFKRLERGPLPLDQVLKFGAQIADALDKAHRNGVVHRDLKPGNIMLTAAGAKLLDFGLAKLPAAQAIGAALTTQLTQTAPVTEAGSIVGTFQYMSPEQIEGADLDGRSDIFALGAVLYEMLTGKLAFPGKSQLSVASAIMEKEPEPISNTKPLTPPALDHAIRLCLAKSPENRWQTARDLALDLNWIAEGGSQAGVAAPVAAHRRTRKAIAFMLLGAGTAILGVAVLSIFLVHTYLNQPRPNVVRFLIAPPSEVSAWESFTPSPDGRFLAFVGFSKDGTRRLWLRPLDDLSAQPVPGTEGALSPFWSPDSKYVAFFGDHGLMKVAVSGGIPQAICDARGASLTGSWSSNGEIIFSTEHGGFLKVSEADGAPSPLTTLDLSVSEFTQLDPWFLPDGRHFLYISNRHTSATILWLCAGSLDSNETNCLMKIDSPGVFYAPPGYLLYLSGGNLVAQPFDASNLTVKGDPIPIAASVESFSLSGNGVLAYVTGGVTNQVQLQWFDRTGKNLDTVGQAGQYSSPEVSPDGTRLIVALMDPQLTTRDLWLFDLKRKAGSRFTSDPTDELNPRWSSDGNQIIFSSTQNGNRDIYQKAANGIGDTQLVFASKDQRKSVDDWSSDGRYVVYDTTKSPAHLWILPLFGDRKPVPFVQENYDTRQARFSPNGRYIAYASDESGQYEIYVQTFPQPSGKWQVSSGGGEFPEWRRDGKELFFVSAGKMMAVGMDTAAPKFTAGIPKPLFGANFLPATPNAIYAPSADGQRFLIITATAQQSLPPVTVVTNWTSELKP